MYVCKIYQQTNISHAGLPRPNSTGPIWLDSGLSWLRRGGGWWIERLVVAVVVPIINILPEFLCMFYQYFLRPPLPFSSLILGIFLPSLSLFSVSPLLSPPSFPLSLSPLLPSDTVWNINEQLSSLPSSFYVYQMQFSRRGWDGGERNNAIFFITIWTEWSKLIHLK